MSSAGRFVSGLMLKFPHCASCTVISGCVLSGQRVQLQEELVLGCVSRDGDAALKWWVVISTTTTTYVPYPLQLLFWWLPDPAPVVTTGNGVTGDRAGEGQWLWWLHQARSWLLKLNLGQNSFRQKSQFCQSHVVRTPHGHMYEVGTLTRKGCHQVKKIKQFHLLEYTSFSSEVGLLWERCELPEYRRGFNIELEDTFAWGKSG